MTGKVESVKFDDISKEVNRVTPKSIYEKLSAIQIELKAPKSQYNKFGNYYYRSCEDILEAVKPLCNKNEVTLMIGDEIVCIEGRHYVKATAVLIDWQTGRSVQNVAYARESATKKGMDDSQVTGSTSTYARKYALNGLFNIDDTKDNDTSELKQEADTKAQKAKKESLQASVKDVKERQRKLDELDIDIHEASVKQWMYEHTGYQDQNVDLQDEVKNRKLINAYDTLIAGKEKRIKEAVNANATQA